jgi:amino acid adenylation domain-containing protein/FkbM family methyltransferase
MVAEWARRAPGSAAVQCGGATLTYRQLHETATAAAARIRQSGSPPGSLVAVPADRSADTVCAIVGILQAGCAYLPIDPAQPADRTARILAQAAPGAVLANACDLLTGAGGLVGRALPASAPPAASSLAYVMPTSGTGGTVKLAEVPHAAIHHNLRALSAAVGGITPGDRYLHLASFAFSSSVRQLFLPLASGACAVIATGDQRLDPNAMLRLIHASRVTVLDIIPSVLSLLTDALETQPSALDGTALRLVLLASEPLPAALIRRWHAAGGPPDAAVYNMYGATETAGIASIHPVSQPTGDGTVPIGRPLPGTTLSLLGPAGEPVPGGGPGQIAVSGPGIAAGYRGDAGLTAQKFPHPRPGSPERLYLTGDIGTRDAIGAISFAGRADRTVKVRGRHVDLTAVEQALQEHDAVAEAAAVVAEGPDGTPSLRAYARLAPSYLDQHTASRLRRLPNGLRVIDLNQAETDHMYEEVVTRQVYFQHGITIPDDALVIDAGANIGLFSLAVTASYPGARVIAFEPAPPTADVLRANLRANGSPDVRVRVQGLSDRSGTATLTWYRRASGLSSFHPDHDEERATLMAIIAYQSARGTIPPGHELEAHTDGLADAKLAAEQLPCTLTRLSDVLDAEGIDKVDLLKIDVQKSELEVLAGIDDRHWSRIRQIAVEVHDTGDRVRQVIRLLAGHGYHIAVGGDPIFPGTRLQYLYARRDPGPRPAAPPPPARRRAARPRGSVSPGDLTAFLTRRLGDQPAPESVEILNDFPRTVSGKIDRPRLAARSPGTAPATEPPHAGDPVAAGIAAIWREILGRDPSPGDDFFEAGGSSLSAARVTTRVRQRFAAPDISIRVIFDQPRLDQYTAAVRAQLPAGGAPRPVTQGPTS